MPSAADLEAYMDEHQDLYFAMHPDEKCGARRQWSYQRSYIAQVRDGLVRATTIETKTPTASEYLTGLRRTLGDELHPRTSIRKRQLMELARAGFDCTHLWRQHEEMEAEKATIRAEKEATSEAPEEQCQSA
jgi:hypothetical protein